MRKFLLFSCSFISFFICVTYGVGGNLIGDGKHEFYLLSSSSSAKIVSLPEDKAQSFIYLKRELKGESVEFLNVEDAKRLIVSLRAKKILTENSNEFYCEYFYSPYIPYSVWIKGNRINLHISYGKEKTVVGSPIIFGSF